MSEWISVEDRLPEPSQWVVVKLGGVVAKGKRSALGWGQIKMIDQPFSIYDEVTHWKPMQP